MRTVTRAGAIGLILGSAGLVVSCGGGTTATATERLWVSGIPTNAKEPLTAFVTMRSGEDKFLGAFFHGTLLRGSHDVFNWEPTGNGRARVEYLQDGHYANLRFESCKPSTGYDHCLLVTGGPTGTQRYQSRKRWVVRRPGRKRDATVGLFAVTLAELAEDDEQLASALDAAAAVGQGPAS
ncbi:MAG: hypothetical protein K0V04_11605 [Deltaproteobacteria bacterium]|nr:hypothetical protein [Deltaproteobacteria bacterium]